MNDNMNNLEESSDDLDIETPGDDETGDEPAGNEERESAALKAVAAALGVRPGATADDDMILADDEEEAGEAEEAEEEAPAATKSKRSPERVRNEARAAKLGIPASLIAEMDDDMLAEEVSEPAAKKDANADKKPAETVSFAYKINDEALDGLDEGLVGEVKKMNEHYAEKMKAAHDQLALERVFNAAQRFTDKYPELFGDTIYIEPDDAEMKNRGELFKAWREIADADASAGENRPLGKQLDAAFSKAFPKRARKKPTAIAQPSGRTARRDDEDDTPKDPTERRALSAVAKVLRDAGATKD